MPEYVWISSSRTRFASRPALAPTPKTCRDHPSLNCWFSISVVVNRMSGTWSCMAVRVSRNSSGVTWPPHLWHSRCPQFTRSVRRPAGRSQAERAAAASAVAHRRAGQERADPR